MSETGTPSDRPQKHRWIPIVCTIIVVVAIGAGIVERRFLSNRPPPSETPLGQNNARLDLTPKPLWQDDTKSLYINFGISNGGKSTAMEHHHLTAAIATPSMLDQDLIDAFFIVFKNKYKKNGLVVANNEIFAGQSDQFFSVPATVPGMQFGTPENYAAAKEGRILVFAFVMERYRDTNLPENKFLYTERCIYLGLGGSIHNCEAGHNRSFISD